ncbi:MAG: hypothetical protein NVS1B13_10160 [Flavisolibacter sp.]
MTTIQIETAPANEVPVTANYLKKKRLTVLQRTWMERDIVLNVGFEESIKRGLITIFIPWSLLAVNHNLLIYAAPVMFYLFVSALTHFCFIRYAWQHWVIDIETPAICDFATDLNIPVETI